MFKKEEGQLHNSTTAFTWLESESEYDEFGGNTFSTTIEWISARSAYRKTFFMRSNIFFCWGHTSSDSHEAYGTWYQYQVRTWYWGKYR
jgi:hypothetical protein